MTWDDDWTCCGCGHEIDPDTRQCIIWDFHNNMHFVPDNSHYCTCHGYDMEEVNWWRGR